MPLFKKFLKREKTHVGMDIGSYAVKTVELSLEEKGIRIKNFGYAKIEKPELGESIIHAIKDSAQKAKVLEKDVSIAISGPSVIIRFVELPVMTKDELRNSITFEAEKYIPFNIDEVIMEHQVLIPRLGESKMLVLLVAAKKDLLNEYLKLVNEAGVSVEVVDVASFANVNAFLSSPQRANDEVVALVDVGAKATDINIIDAGILYFTRCLQSGGNDLTKYLAEALSVDWKEAENLKMNPGDKSSEISDNVESFILNIINEIRLSFSYYENQSGKNISKVYATGGGSRVINFYPLLKENLGLDVVPWDTVGTIEIDPSLSAHPIRAVKEELGTAIGLAIR